MGQSITELTAAGLLTLGGPMVGAPGDDLDSLCLLSLSLGCACMICWAYETRERFGPDPHFRQTHRKFPLDWKFGILRAKFPEFPLSTPLQTRKFPEFPQFPHRPRLANFQKEFPEIWVRAKPRCPLALVSRGQVV